MNYNHSHPYYHAHSTSNHDDNADAAKTIPILSAHTPSNSPHDTAYDTFHGGQSNYNDAYDDDHLHDVCHYDIGGTGHGIR